MKGWYTARELAELQLPGLAASKRGINRLALAKGWKDRGTLARRRVGKEGGGGWEYHHSLVTEGLEPQRFVVTEQTLDECSREDQLKAIDPLAQVVVLSPEEMAVLNRIAASNGMPTALLTQHWLKQLIAMLQVAA